MKSPISTTVIRNVRRTVVGGLVLGAAAAGVTACGGSSTVVQGKVLDVETDLPMQGAQGGTTTDLLNGAKLALAQSGDKAGQFTVRLKALDDSTTASGNYDLGQCVSNGNAEAADPNTIAVIGTFNSGCAEQTIPILNDAGIAMVSPGNTYLGLTKSVPGATQPGEPGKYYPTGTRNYVRILPNDGIQAYALVQAVKDAGVKHLAIASDGSAYGDGLARLMRKAMSAYGLHAVSVTTVDPNAATYRPYAEKIAGEGADGFVYLGYTSSGGNKITNDVATVLPQAKLFGPDGMCSSSWTDPNKGGLPLADDSRMQCTVATLDLQSYPGGPAFLRAYKAAYGNANPDPYAINGYEAMKLTLDTIAGLGSQGNDRQAVVKALLATKDRKSVLGTYSIDRNGDTTAKTYGLYKVVDGKLKFAKAITPAHTL